MASQALSSCSGPRARVHPLPRLRLFFKTEIKGCKSMSSPHGAQVPPLSHHPQTPDQVLPFVPCTPLHLPHCPPHCPLTTARVLWGAGIPRERGEKNNVELGIVLMEIMLPGNHESWRGQIHLVQDKHQGQPKLSSHVVIKCWWEIHNLEQDIRGGSDARSTQSSLPTVPYSPGTAWREDPGGSRFWGNKDRSAKLN